MFSNADEVLRFIKDEGVKFVDVRFCDLPGVMQHFNVPAQSVDEDFFVNGQMFDGSSIRGFQAIHESDMKLIPDPTTAYLDSFRTEKTLAMNFSIVDPLHRRGLQPRPAQHRGEGRGLPQELGHRRHRVLRRGGGVLRLRQRALRDQAERRLLLHRLRRGRLEHRPRGGGRQPGLQAALQGRLLPGPARSTTTPTCATRCRSHSTRPASQVERAHHEVGTAGQAEINYKFSTLLHAADQLMMFKYIIKNVAWAAGKTATFMPKPLFGDNGSGMHCHQSLWKDGPPLFYDELGYAGLSDMARHYIGGLLKHAPSLLAFTNPTVNSYHRLVPGLRGAGQPGLLAAQPLGLHPHPDHRREPEGQAPRVPRARTRRATPTSRSRRMLMAGLDGIKNKIEPDQPVDKDLYELPPDEHAEIAQVPGLARRGARLARGRPRLPARGRRVHRGPDRDLDRLEADQRDRPDPAAPAPARVRALLRPVGRTGPHRACRPCARPCQGSPSSLVGALACRSPGKRARPLGVVRSTTGSPRRARRVQGDLC